MTGEAKISSGSGAMYIDPDIQALIKERKLVKIETFGRDLTFCVLELTNGAVISGRPCISEAGKHSDQVVQAVATTNALADVSLLEGYREEVERHQ
ncbi:hypothetical protein vBVpP1_46 [Vibrio phage vB_VpP_1]|nr:hypothetical protein vBVpP1_46 [Vibrio phage vB_VpP_1]